jgi:hypothetical protein
MDLRSYTHESSLRSTLFRFATLVHLLLLFSALAIHLAFAKLGQLNNL